MKPRKKEDISKSFLKQVGNQISTFRKEAGITMEKLGLEVGLTRMQVHRIENGYNITMITLLKISLALNVKLSDLLDFKYSLDKDALEYLVNTNKSYKIDLKKSKKKAG